MLCQKGPDLSDVVQCKPARSSSFCNVLFESQLVIEIIPRFLTELDGVIVEEPSWMVKSCCRVGVAGKTRCSVFAMLSCRCTSVHCDLTQLHYNKRSSLHCTTNILFTPCLHFVCYNERICELNLHVSALNKSSLSSEWILINIVFKESSYVCHTLLNAAQTRK